jgi:hypothetical protein
MACGTLRSMMSGADRIRLRRKAGAMRSTTDFERVLAVGSERDLMRRVVLEMTREDEE